MQATPDPRETTVAPAGAPVAPYELREAFMGQRGTASLAKREVVGIVSLLLER